jgi:hypothetical protein
MPKKGAKLGASSLEDIVLASRAVLGGGRWLLEKRCAGCCCVDALMQAAKANAVR